MNEIVTILGFFGSMSFMVWVVFTRPATAGARQCFRGPGCSVRLLDRFGSSPELLAYSRPARASAFMESAFIEHRSAFSRILTGLQAGIVFTIVGVAMLFLRNRIWDAARGFLFLGTLLLAIGVGCLIAAGAAYLFSRSQGMLDQPSHV